MSLHSGRLKNEIGVRELHDQLSRYVQFVAAGAEVHVTLHGRRVAQLVPARPETALDDLRARGLVREPADVKWKPSGKSATKATVSDLVTAQRR